MHLTNWLRESNKKNGCLALDMKIIGIYRHSGSAIFLINEEQGVDIKL